VWNIYKENQCVFKFGGEGGEGDDDEKEGEEGVDRGAQGGVGGHGDEEEEEEHEDEEQEECAAEVVEGAGDGFEEAWLSQRRRCQNSSSEDGNWSAVGPSPPLGVITTSSPCTWRVYWAGLMFCCRSTCSVKLESLEASLRYLSTRHCWSLARLSLTAVASSSLCRSSSSCESLRDRQLCAAILFLPRRLMSRQRLS